MKVLQIHNRYRLSGGEDSVVDNEAAGLREAGHEVFQFAATNPTRPVSTAAKLLASPWNPRQFQAIKRQVIDNDFDIAHVHNTWFSITPSVIDAIERQGIPIVMTVHNFRLVCINSQLTRDSQPCTACVGGSPWRGVRYSCYRGSRASSAIAAGALSVGRKMRLWDNVSKFIVPSQFVRGVLAQGGIEQDRMTVRPHFVHDPGQRTAPSSQSNTVLFAGRIEEAKGVCLLLEAWDDADTGHLQLELLGDGPLRRELEHRYPDVTFSGTVPQAEVVRRMMTARALVIPSQVPETMGLTALEAFAASLPVVASDIGALPEILAGQGPQWNVGADDTAGWVSAIELLKDDALVDEAGTRNRATYRERYSPRTAIPSLVSVYNKVRAG